MAAKSLYGPEDVFDAGRMLHIQGSDRRAAQSLAALHADIGAGKVVNMVGAMSLERADWTPDVARAKDFYHAAVFGWEFYDRRESPEAVFTRIFNRGRFNGGMLQLDGRRAVCGCRTFTCRRCRRTPSIACEELGGAIEIEKGTSMLDGAQVVCRSRPGRRPLLHYAVGRRQIPGLSRLLNSSPCGRLE